LTSLSRRAIISRLQEDQDGRIRRPIRNTIRCDRGQGQPGKAPAVRFVEQRVTGVHEALVLAPASATSFRIPVR
jgi:hypothetical protein